MVASLASITIFIGATEKNFAATGPVFSVPTGIRASTYRGQRQPSPAPVCHTARELESLSTSIWTQGSFLRFAYGDGVALSSSYEPEPAHSQTFPRLSVLQSVPCDWYTKGGNCAVSTSALTAGLGPVQPATLCFLSSGCSCSISPVSPGK